MEMVRDVLAAIGALCVLCTAVLAAWIGITSQREGEPITREERERRWRERVDRYWGDA